MKCPHCKENHPDDFKFCPITGKEIPEIVAQELLACENEDCIDFGKHIIPLDSKFCPRCGMKLTSHVSDTSIRKETFKLEDVEFEMIRIEGGTFWMGAQGSNASGKNYDPDAYDNENPEHQVAIPDYSIGKHLVTQELWQVVMGYNPSYFRNDSSLPVECISWNEIMNKFLPKLNELLNDQLDGRRFMLPSEAQWEYAARGGNNSKGCRYSGSDNINDVTWYSDNSSYTTHPVGRKKPNELGLCDMSGNVWEWCRDRYEDYSTDFETNPIGPSSGSYRVLRGGCFGFNARDCRVSYRGYEYPGCKFAEGGFRLSLSLALEYA